MGHDLVKEGQKPLTPGFGVAGQVVCPRMSVTHQVMCVKQGCENWVELKQGDRTIARCAYSWLPLLMVELRGSVDKLREVLDGNDKRK